ncbi:MAG: helix-turn-helix domain-containing protein [Deltaproteobacteria bacterium]|nr:helix-turn-helix domain-containing protein [Deltaproteobacteria bacterium]
MKKQPKLTYEQAAEYLGVALPTLYSLVCRKAVPHVRLSARMVRFDVDDLDRWLDSRRVVPVARGSSA